MPVLIERVDTSQLIKGGEIILDYLTEIPAGAKNVAVVNDFPTGKEPLCVVNCEKDNLEANLYLVKPYLYLPVFRSHGFMQALVFDRNKDEFPMKRIKTLEPNSNVYNLPVKKNGEFTKSWIRFTLFG